MMSGNGRTEGKQKVGLQGSKGTKESRKAESRRTHGFRYSPLPPALKLHENHQETAAAVPTLKSGRPQKKTPQPSSKLPS